MWFNRKKKIAGIDNGRNDALVLCYTDASGRKYYKWKNPLAIPTMRYLAGWSAIEYANMGTNAKEALEHLNKALDSLNANKAGEAAYYITSFRNRIVSADPEKAYLELASCYCVLQDENIKAFDAALSSVKVALWQTDLDAKAFFLNFAFKTSAFLMKSLKESTPSVLATQMKQMMRLLSSTLPKESMKDSTN